MDDLLQLYRLKQSILKKRVGVGVFSLKFDNYTNSLSTKVRKDFPKILDDTIENLDLVQIYAGISLLESFQHVANTAPYLLSQLWLIVRERTYWNQYTQITEKLSDCKEVSDFTAKFWALPSKNAIGEAKRLSGNAIGFLSCVDDILRSLSISLRELDVAVDWLWGDSVVKG